ncbi:MAG: hypothetical protein ACLQQ4_00515 [Bacteroidia bacterium]
MSKPFIPITLVVLLEVIFSQEYKLFNDNVWVVFFEQLMNCALTLVIFLWIVKNVSKGVPTNHFSGKILTMSFQAFLIFFCGKSIFIFIKYFVIHKIFFKDILLYQLTKAFTSSLECFFCAIIILYITIHLKAKFKLIISILSCFIFLLCFRMMLWTITYFQYEFYSTGEKYRIEKRDFRFGHNGIYEEWYKNGQIKKIGKYNNGIRIGKWLEYSDSGKVLNQIDYDTIIKKNQHESF